MIRIAGKSHQGKRAHNEDFVIADAQQGLAVVADGMGGRSAGEVASELAAGVIQDRLRQSDNLVDAVLAAHREVIAAAHDGRGKPGMGTTVAVVQLQGPNYRIAWVGDSRVYLWNGELLQLTRDHSYVEALIAQGKLAPEEAAQNAQRNLVTQALGIEELKSLDVKVISGELGSGEQLLICSDGLNDELGNAGIAQILLEELPLDDMVDELVTRAVTAGGRDNISVVLVDPGAAAGPGSKPPSPVSKVDREGREHFYPPENFSESTQHAFTVRGDERLQTERGAVAARPQAPRSRLAGWLIGALAVTAIIVAWFFL